jgi:membrane protein YqaA with SNARE-associated domain
MFFSKIYSKILTYSKHPHASYYLAGLSISEAIFFPIPPDVMLAPMVLSKPESAWKYASLTSITSVLGGLIGYLAGMFFFTLVRSWLQYMGYESAYMQVQQWFLIWGFWAVLIAGFTPAPYKIFTIAAGASGMPLIPFILASLISRSGRFFLVSAIVRWSGGIMEKILLRYIEWIGWLIVLIFVLYLLFRTFH